MLCTISIFPPNAITVHKVIFPKENFLPFYLHYLLQMSEIFFYELTIIPISTSCFSKKYLKFFTSSICKIFTKIYASTL